MQNRRPSHIHHFLAVGLLVIGFLTGCNQPSSLNGETVDSALKNNTQQEDRVNGKTTFVESNYESPSQQEAEKSIDEEPLLKASTPTQPDNRIDVPLEEQNDQDIQPNNSPESPLLALKSEDNSKEIEELPPAIEWEGDHKLTFKELYASVSSRGVTLSDKVKGLSGQEVEMSGFMAPPLTANVTFFVLSKIPLAVCPFCSSDADWPTDIVVVFMPEGEEIVPTEHPVKVTGILETGSHEDGDTGFISLIRINAEQVEVVKK